MQNKNIQQQKKISPIKPLTPKKGIVQKNPKSPNYQLPKKGRNNKTEVKVVKKNIKKNESEDEEMDSSDNEESEILRALKRKLENDESGEDDSDEDVTFDNDNDDCNDDDDDDDDDEDDDDNETNNKDDDEEDNEINSSENEESESGDDEEKKLSSANKIKRPEKAKKVDNPQKTRLLTREEKPRTVYVGNWPLSKNNDDLSAYFSKYGEVETAKVWLENKNYPNKSKSSNSAHVTFVDKECAVKATEENARIVDGRHLIVNIFSNNKPDQSKALWVGNIPFDSEEDDLWGLFEDCGKITDIRVVRKDGRSRGFGFVNFESEDGVTNALEKNNFTIQDRTIFVKRGTDKPEYRKPDFKRKNPRKPNYIHKKPRMDDSVHKKPKTHDSAHKKRGGGTFTPKKKSS